MNDGEWIGPPNGDSVLEDVTAMVRALERDKKYGPPWRMVPMKICPHCNRTQLIRVGPNQQQPTVVLFCPSCRRDVGTLLIIREIA